VDGSSNHTWKSRGAVLTLAALTLETLTSATLTWSPPNKSNAAGHESGRLGAQ
jgi:hypothetical protein